MAGPLPVQISVVVPVYGYAGCLAELCERLHSTLRKLTASYEVILVDDRGPDDAWSVIQEQASRSAEVRGIRLSRNFGQHAAIAAGLTVSRGEWVAVLDCDLQDPPEAIARLYEEATGGADIVFARRRQRTESALRQTVSRAYFRILNMLSDQAVDGREGSLSLFSRKVASSYLAVADQDRHHVMLLNWLGYRRATIEYDQEPRRGGKSSYGLSALLDSAICGLFFSSAKLLRLIVYAGALFAVAGFLLAIALVIRRYALYTAPGWTSIIVVELIVGGAILLSVGTVGMYIGRIFDQVRQRPLFIIDQETALSAEPIKAASVQ